MTQMQIRKLIRLANGNPINGYSDEGAEQKNEFLYLCRLYLRMIAKEMGLQKGQYDIRVNPAGPAVSGDVHLHSDKLYIAFSQGCMGRGFGFMYRSVSNRRDFTGGYNRWMRWDNLIDVPYVAETFKKTSQVFKRM